MIVYIETNFIIGAATGRDPGCDDLLRIPADDLRIAIPDVCVMEACTWFEGERQRRLAFARTLDLQIDELVRDRSSIHARLLRGHLSQAAVENERVLNDVMDRFDDCLRHLHGSNGKVGGLIRATELINIVAGSRINVRQPVTDQPTDNLILSIIGAHARANPTERKVLLSGNSNDFNTADVQALLRERGITEYFTRTDAFLGWFHSLPPTPPS